MKSALAALLLFFFAVPPILSRGSQTSGDSQESTSRAQAQPAKSFAIQLDPCSLLTRAEIFAVQGEPVAALKRDVKPQGNFVLSECLFRSNTFSKSISLALALPLTSGSAASGPRQFWEGQFHTAHASQRVEPERDHDSVMPRALPGIGEEAYWVGDPILGAMYVLQGDSFLRISVGGEKVELARLRKSEVLAGIALKRLKEAYLLRQPPE